MDDSKSGVGNSLAADRAATAGQCGTRNLETGSRIFRLDYKCTSGGDGSYSSRLSRYQLIQQRLARQDVGRAGGPQGGSGRLSRSLLERRDRYIATRISETLGTGDTGIVFLGFLHSLERLLARDIRLQYPFGRRAPRGKLGAS
jgi:hypothetical protein